MRTNIATRTLDPGFTALTKPERVSIFWEWWVARQIAKKIMARVRQAVGYIKRPTDIQRRSKMGLRVGGLGKLVKRTHEYRFKVRPSISGR